MNREDSATTAVTALCLLDVGVPTARCLVSSRPQAALTLCAALCRVLDSEECVAVSTALAPTLLAVSPSSALGRATPLLPEPPLLLSETAAGSAGGGIGGRSGTVADDGSSAAATDVAGGLHADAWRLAEIADNAVGTIDACVMGAAGGTTAAKGPGRRAAELQRGEALVHRLRMDLRLTAGPMLGIPAVGAAVVGGASSPAVGTAGPNSPSSGGGVGGTASGSGSAGLVGAPVVVVGACMLPARLVQSPSVLSWLRRVDDGGVVTEVDGDGDGCDGGETAGSATRIRDPLPSVLVLLTAFSVRVSRALARHGGAAYPWRSGNVHWAELGLEGTPDRRLCWLSLPCRVLNFLARVRLGDAAVAVPSHVLAAAIAVGHAVIAQWMVGCVAAADGDGNRAGVASPPGGVSDPRLVAAVALVTSVHVAWQAVDVMAPTLPPSHSPSPSLLPSSPVPDVSASGSHGRAGASSEAGFTAVTGSRRWTASAPPSIAVCHPLLSTLFRADGTQQWLWYLATVSVAAAAAGGSAAGASGATRSALFRLGSRSTRSGLPTAGPPSTAITLAELVKHLLDTAPLLFDSDVKIALVRLALAPGVFVRSPEAAVAVTPGGRPSVTPKVAAALAAATDRLCEAAASVEAAGAAAGEPASAVATAAAVVGAGGRHPHRGADLPAVALAPLVLAVNADAPVELLRLRADDPARLWQDFVAKFGQSGGDGTLRQLWRVGVDGGSGAGSDDDAAGRELLQWITAEAAQRLFTPAVDGRSLIPR